MMLRTPMSARAAARVLASIVRRVLAADLSAPCFAVLFGGEASVVVGDTCLCRFADVQNGIEIEWAPYSGEARSLLLPLLAAALGG